MARINVFQNRHSLKIYINEKLHLFIKQKDLVGLQSWYSSTTEAERQCGFFEKKYVIEYITTRNVITTEYNKIEMWEEVLRLINAHLK